ncbi:Forkhead box protein N3 [Varanus komodoensis]|nr:Forkhead box protein N3 [Varanus komodoensis]
MILVLKIKSGSDANGFDPDIDAATAMMLLNTPPEIQAVPPGVIQNGTRILSRGIFPGVRPLPINPIGSMAAAVRYSVTLNERSLKFSCDYLF